MKPKQVIVFIQKSACQSKPCVSRPAVSGVIGSSRTPTSWPCECTLPSYPSPASTVDKTMQGMQENASEYRRKTEYIELGIYIDFFLKF